MSGFDVGLDRAPDEMSSRAERWARRRSRVDDAGVYFCSVIALAVGIPLLVANSHTLALGAGWSGTSGEIISVSCSVGAPQQCEGWFVPTGAGPTIVDLPVGGHQDWNPNVDYPARLSADNSMATAVGPSQVDRSLAGILVAAAMVVFGAGTIGFGLVRWYVRRRFGPTFAWLPGQWVPLVLTALLGCASFFVWLTARTSYR